MRLTKTQLTQLIERVERWHSEIVATLPEFGIPSRSLMGDYLETLRYSCEDTLANYRGQLARGEHDPDPEPVTT